VVTTALRSTKASFLPQQSIPLVFIFGQSHPLPMLDAQISLLSLRVPHRENTRLSVIISLNAIVAHLKKLSIWSRATIAFIEPYNPNVLQNTITSITTVQKQQISHRKILLSTFYKVYDITDI
jgi:hypothetical protein